MSEGTIGHGGIHAGGEQAAAEDDRGDRPCCKARPRRATI